MLQDAETVVRAGASAGPLSQRRQAFMRYHGQGHEIDIALPDRALVDSDIADMRRAFEAAYSRQFSRAVPGMTIEILNWGLEVSSAAQPLERYPDRITPRCAAPHAQRQILCDVTGGWRAAALHDRAALHPGDHLEGPALIIEPQTTTFVSADFAAHVDGGHNIWLTRKRETRP
jgi:N-methylhydantoinase A